MWEGGQMSYFFGTSYIRYRSVFMTWGGAGDFLGGYSFFIKNLRGVSNFGLKF